MLCRSDKELARRVAAAPRAHGRIVLAGAVWLGACSGSVNHGGWDGVERGGSGPVNQATPAAAGDAGSAAPPSEELLEAGGAGPAPDSSDAGEPGATSELPPSEPRCDAVAEVLRVSCGNGSCHSNPGAVIGDFAVSEERVLAFVDRTSTRGARCGKVIDVADPGRSLILTKLTGTFPPDCGGAMPVGSFQISDTQVACMADWVEQFRR